MIEKGVARLAFRFQHLQLAAAGIDQEAEREGKVGLAREVTDRLGTAVLFQYEIVLIQIIDDAAVGIANRSQQRHDIDGCGKPYFLRGGPRESGKEQTSARENCPHRTCCSKKRTCARALSDWTLPKPVDAP